MKCDGPDPPPKKKKSTCAAIRSELSVCRFFLLFFLGRKEKGKLAGQKTWGWEKRTEHTRVFGRNVWHPQHSAEQLPIASGCWVESISGPENRCHPVVMLDLPRKYWLSNQFEISHAGPRDRGRVQVTLDDSFHRRSFQNGRHLHSIYG